MNKLRVVALVFVFLAFASSGRAAFIYVAPGGTGDGSIGSPTHLQAALDTARTNAQDDTIFLQEGDYIHDPGFLYAATGTDTTSVIVTGGWNAAYTVQSDDRTVSRIDGQNARRGLKITGDGAGVDVEVELDNLTIQNGQTNEYAAPPGETGYGAGISATTLNGARVKLVIERCVVRDNEVVHASSVGGGLYLNCDHALRGSDFLRNKAKSAGGAIASIYAAPYTQALAPTIEDCIFEENQSTNSGGSHLYTVVAPVIRRSEFMGRPGGLSSGGGAINSVNGAYPTFEGCLFVGNVGDYWGGAMHFWDAGGVIRNCLFVGNKAGASGDGAGGALTMYDPSPATARTVTVTNSTFVGNLTAGYQGVGGAIHNRVQGISVANCIFSNNGYTYLYGGTTYYNYGGYYALMDESGAGTVGYSNVQGGLGSTGFIGGSGNINLDPLFVVGDSDYHLQSGSPCVDAGTAAAVPAELTTDYEDDPRIFAIRDRNAPVVDMGCDEYYDGVLNFTSPVAGALWVNDGTARSIAWDCQNIPGDVRLYLWQGERFTGHEVQEIDDAVSCAAGSYSWTPPADLPDAADYAIAMNSLTYPEVDHGVGPIAIQHQHLMLLSPNGGQSFTQGTTYPITWQPGTLPGALIKVELYRGAVLSNTIVTGAANTGSRTWKVPYTQLPGAEYKIRISTTAPVPSEDWSDANFKIVPALTVTAPNGGQRWKRGTQQRITWSYKNHPGKFVKIELYRNGRFNRTIIASAPVGAAGRGSYLWTIPATLAPGTTYAVRVRSTVNANCFDLSNRTFSITR